MRTIPRCSALVLGLLALGLGWFGRAPPAPAPPPSSLAARVAALEGGGPRPWYASGPRARFLEAMGLLTRVERELAQLGAPLGDAWNQGVEAARGSQAAALGAWMARLQGVLAADPDADWQALRQSSAAWTQPALPRRVVSPGGVLAALRLVDPGGVSAGVQEVAWVGGGHVLLLGHGAAWLGAVGIQPQRMALPPETGGQLGLMGTYANRPWEVAVRGQQADQDVLVLLRLDGPGGPRTLGVVPAEGPCGPPRVRLRRLDEPEVHLEVLRECGDGHLRQRDLWPLRQGRYSPPHPPPGRGLRVVLRG